MRKTFLTLTALCFAITMAFGQKRIDVQLSDDHPSHEEPIIYNNSTELCRFVIEKGETDTQGNTSVSIKLEKADDDYLFLLFNRAIDKKTLRDNGVYLAENLPGGESVQKVENVELAKDFVCISPKYGTRDYLFPEITIKEGKVYECVVPIHVAKEKEMFMCSKKKKTIESILEISIKITVEESDHLYPSLKRQCDSLVTVFNDSIEANAFCTNKLHQISFEDQIKQYTNLRDDLRLQINLAKNNWKVGSSKYQNYENLLASLDNMDDSIEDYKDSGYDCGDKTKHKTIHSCKYCKLSLEEIYNQLNRYYMNLYNGKVVDEKEIKRIKNDAYSLYKCSSTSSKHTSQWRKGGLVIDKIIERYNQIKAYGQ